MNEFDVLSKGAGIAQTIKAAAELARKANLVDLERALLDLRDELADARDANLELRTEIRRLRDENGDLKARLQRREELVFDRNVWWKIESAGNRVGPFCPRCYGDGERAVRMSHQESQPDGYSRSLWYQCPVCGATADS